MTKKCTIDESMLVDYLDNTLNARERYDLELHLSQCETCRKKVDSQKSWLGLVTQSSIAADPAHIASVSTLNNLKNRIMDEIGQEEKKASAKKARNFWHRPTFWLQTAGVAAAALVLVLAMPLLLDVWQSTRSNSEAGYADNLTATTTGATVAAMKIIDSEDKRGTTTGDGWTVFKGSLAELPSMGCFFIASDCGAPSSEKSDETSAGDATGETTTLQQSQEMTAANFFLSSNRKLNAEGQALLDLLNQAEKLRIMTNFDQPDNVFILAAFNVNQVDSYAEQLKLALQTCQNPIEIEIIRSVELSLKLERLEAGLYGRVFSESPGTEISWILILIGA
ncbi:MAG: zf-HC2 domain-containing protein [Bacillota bacterium]|nr:zf-HC2 domain-containing protein [Bacillota bacterium]